MRVSSSFVKFRQRDPNVTRGSTACSSLTPPPTLTQPETLTQPRKHCVQLPNHTPPTLTQPETLTQHWAIRNAQCAMRSCAHEAGADAQCAMRNAHLRSRDGRQYAIRNAQCAVALTRRSQYTHPYAICSTQCAVALTTIDQHRPIRSCSKIRKNTKNQCGAYTVFLMYEDKRSAKVGRCCTTRPCTEKL